MTNATRPDSVTCLQCGTEKAVGKRGPIPIYCSPNCRSAAKYQRTLIDGRYEAELAAARELTRQKRAANLRPCPYCKSLMTSPRRKQCGAAECGRAFQADRMREWNRQYQAATGQWYHRNYAEGQRVYSRLRAAELGNSRKRYPAAAAAGDARRRMRLQQARTCEVFAPIDVHTRDEWTCKLCLQPIDPEVAWPDPMSPSVDHVIPLSRGGAHAMHNVQSAHLGCNSSKGDKLLIELVIAAGAQATQR